MRVLAAIALGIGGQGDVEARLVGLPRGRFDPCTGGHAQDHHLRDTQLLQPLFEARGLEGSGCSLGDQDVGWLEVQLWQKLCPPFWKAGAESRLLGAAGSHSIHVYQDDRQPLVAKGFDQRDGPGQNITEVVDHGNRGNSLLQVDDDEGGVSIEFSDCHAGLL